MISINAFEEILSAIIEYNEIEKNEIYKIFEQIGLNKNEIEKLLNVLIDEEKIEKIYYLNDKNNYFITKKEKIEPVLSEKEIENLLKGDNNENC